MDSAHSYIVLLPGIHTTSAYFDAKKATICASNVASVPGISLNHKSSVAIRDLKVIDSIHTNILGRGYAISANDSELRLDNVTFELTNREALEGSPRITIRDSVISGGIVTAYGNIFIDRTTFLPGSGVSILGLNNVSQQTMTITNSVFISRPGFTTININSNTDTTSPGTALVKNNTFINPGIDCNGSELYPKIFNSNIFYNPNELQTRPGCSYNHNLLMPAVDVGGAGNAAGDPLFVNIINNDFHLRAGSPAIDASPESGDPNDHDRDGQPRPQGARSDIGAFEYVP